VTDDVTDELADFERTSFTADGTTRAVFRLGTGPAVIVIAEVPGITPHVAGFARRVADQGLSAVLPHLFGDPGAPTSPLAAIRTIVPACVSREFTVLATGRRTCVHLAILRRICCSNAIHLSLLP
jgi:dienelactone hydrolase